MRVQILFFRKRNFPKQIEGEHNDWPDVECHRFLAKNINSPKLSHEPPCASKPCRQNTYFWLIRSHVSQSSEVTSLHIIPSLSFASLGDVKEVVHPSLAFLFSSLLLSFWKSYTVVSGLFSCCCYNLAQLLCALRVLSVLLYSLLN